MLHTLLETNNIDDVLFIQEPWFCKVTVAWSDTHPQGVDVLGGVAHPAWLGIHPYFVLDSCAKVMTYVRKFQQLHPTRPTTIQVVMHNDLLAHPCLQLLDIRAHKVHFCVLNFYNDVVDPTTLDTLLHFQFDNSIPHILLGDFNLHSWSWSPPTWTPSAHVSDLEEHLAEFGFSLCNQPGLPTRQGLSTERPSTIDLIWTDIHASLHLSLLDPLVLWEDSIGSDHVLLRLAWYLGPTLLDQTIAQSLTLHTKHLPDDAHAAWIVDVKCALPMLSSLHTLQLTIDFFLGLTMAITLSNETHFPKRKPTRAWSQPWWNMDCTNAARQLRGTPREC